MIEDKLVGPNVYVTEGERAGPDEHMIEEERAGSDGQVIEDKLAVPDRYVTEGEQAGPNKDVIKNAEAVKNFGQLMMKRAPKMGIKVAQAARVELSNDRLRPPGGQVIQGGDRPPPQAAQQGRRLQMERREQDQLPDVAEEDESRGHTMFLLLGLGAKLAIQGGKLLRPRGDYPEYVLLCVVTIFFSELHRIEGLKLVLY